VTERMDEELMADLDEAEGAAESFDAADEFEDVDSFDGDLGEEEEWEAAEEETDLADDFESEAFEDHGDEAGDEDAELEEAMAFALGAEDTDEFFRRAFRAVRRVGGQVVRTARRAAPHIGRIARAAAPIARLIPHPWARAAGPALSLLGRLRAEGASEEEAMDAFAELAVDDEAALPVLGGLAARALVRSRGASLPLPARRQLVRSLTMTARGLQGRAPAAVRALPRIVRSVRRTTTARRTPARVVPRIVQRAATRVVRTPRLVRQLTRPSPVAQRRVRRALATAGPAAVAGVAGVAGPAGRRRSFTLHGPVRIAITSAA
jgi:hypothetical protein